MRPYTVFDGWKEDAMTGKMRLVDRLRYERNERIDHALFYWTQIFMAYNSNLACRWFRYS